MIKTPIKRVEQILSLDDLLIPTVNQINLNLDKFSVEVLLLTWQLHKILPIATNFYTAAWTGRLWVFLSDQKPIDYLGMFEHSLFHASHGGFGIHGISAHVNQHISHLHQSSETWKYKRTRIYPYSFNCRVYLNDLPGIKATHLIEGTDLELSSKLTYEQENL